MWSRKARHFVMADRSCASALNGNLTVSLSQKKLPSLDGLRAVAVTLVIVHHLHVPYSPDGRGVLTFFVLSGFLITWMLLKESETTGAVSVRNFYVRRVLRIFPAFYVFLILSIVARIVTIGWPNRFLLLDYICCFSYTVNYRFALTPNIEHTAWHTWALAIEEQFYLLWPLVFLAFRTNLRKLTRVLIGAIVFVEIYRIVLLFKFHAHEYWLNFSFDCRADHLLIGCLLAVLLKRGVLAPFWNLLTSRLWVSLVPFGLMIGSIALDFRFHHPYRFAVGFVIDPLLTALFLVQVMAFGHTFLWGWLNWRVIRYLGQISYGMFLYHMLANRLAIDLFGRHSLWFRVPVVMALAVLMGALSFHLLEQRFLRLKSRFTATAHRPAAALTPVYELSRT